MRLKFLKSVSNVVKIVMLVMLVVVMYCGFLICVPNAASVIREGNCLENVVTVVSGGGMCNQIFEYVSVWGISKRFGLVPYAPDETWKKLNQVFENLDVPSIEVLKTSLECSDSVENIERYTLAYKDMPVENAVQKIRSAKTPLVLWKWIVLLEVILPYAKELKDHFKFRAELLASAGETLQDVKNKIELNTGEKQIVYVGVHVRRTDYGPYLAKRGVTVQAGIGYYRRAVAWMDSVLREQHEFDGDLNIAYVVASDDIDWCKEKLIPAIEKDLETNTDAGHKGKSGIYYVGKPGDPVLDLVLLSSCNHSIISYGTYGMWTALMAGGWTVYYDVFPFNHDSRVQDTGPMKIAKTLHNWRPLV